MIRVRARRAAGVLETSVWHFGITYCKANMTRWMGSAWIRPDNRSPSAMDGLLELTVHPSADSLS